jgi:hypothetical protein
MVIVRLQIRKMRGAIEWNFSRLENGFLPLVVPCCESRLAVFHLRGVVRSHGSKILGDSRTPFGAENFVGQL